MKSMMRGMIAGALGFCVLDCAGSPAGAQGNVEPGRGPAAGAPMPQSRPSPAPRPQPLPHGRTPEGEPPSASDQPPRGPQGCPDQGRRLELIV